MHTKVSTAINPQILNATVPTATNNHNQWGIKRECSFGFENNNIIVKNQRIEIDIISGCWMRTGFFNFVSSGGTVTQIARDSA
jgi:hypothetical protein